MGVRPARRPPRPARSLTGSGPRASVIIVNRDGLQFLQPCLESVFGQELEGGHEVTVVDNGSADGSPEFVRRAFPEVRLLEAKRNLGFAAGCNLGIRASSGRHVVLLNNDAVVRPGWLAALVAAAESGAGVGAATAKIVYADRPGTLQSAGSLLLSDGSGGDRGMGEEDRGQYDRPEEVFGGNGASLLLSREMLADVGMLDAGFFMYYEDTDLCWRMRLRGWRVLYEPAAVVEHAHAASSGEWSEFFAFHVDRNRLLMILKNARPGFVARSFTGFGRRARGGPGADRPARRAVRGRIARSFLARLPTTLAQRGVIRGRRRVPDADVERWLYPRELWDARSA